MSSFLSGMSSFLRSLLGIFLKFAETDLASQALSCLKHTSEPVAVFVVAIRNFDSDYSFWQAAFIESGVKPHLPALERTADQAYVTVFANLRKSREAVAETEVSTCLLNFHDESPEDLKLPGSLTTEDSIKYMNDVMTMKEAMLIYMDKLLEYHEIGTVEDCDETGEREAVNAVLKDIDAFQANYP